MSVKGKSGYTPRQFVYAEAVTALQRLRNRLLTEQDFDLNENYPALGDERYATAYEAEQLIAQVDKAMNRVGKIGGLSDD